MACAYPSPELPPLPLHRELVAHFTGHWPVGYRQRWARTPWWHLLTTLLSLCGGAAASAVLSMSAPAWWPLLPLSWMLTVHGGRKAQLVICHYAVHGTMTGRRWSDRVLTECLSTVLLIQPFAGYYQHHIRVHHSRHLATLADQDLQFLLRLGFRPGMRREALWRRLYWTLISPRFHALFLGQRLRANFITAPAYRRLMAIGYAAAVVAGLGLPPARWPFVVAWVMPLLPLYHMAALLQFVSEHRWLAVPQPPACALKEVEAWKGKNMHRHRRTSSASRA